MERNRQRVRTLAHKENQCFDCQRHGPLSDVVLPIGIFTCGRCAGLHRSLQGHRVATIQATRWSNEDVELLEAAGNRRLRKRWLAKYPQPGAPNHDANDDQQMDRFIQAVWRDKLFYDPDGGGHRKANSVSAAGSPAGRKHSEAGARGSPAGMIPLPPPVDQSTFDNAFGPGSASPISLKTVVDSPSLGHSELSTGLSELDFLSDAQTPQKPSARAAGAGSPAVADFDSIFDGPPPTVSQSPAAPAQPVLPRQPTSPLQTNGVAAMVEPQGPPIDMMLEYMKRVLKVHSLTREEFLEVVEESLTRLRVPWNRGEAAAVATAPGPGAGQVRQPGAQGFSYLAGEPPSHPQMHHHHHHPQQPPAMDVFGARSAASPFPGDLGDPFGSPAGFPAAGGVANAGPGLVDPFGGGGGLQPQLTPYSATSLVDSLSRTRQHQATTDDDIFGNLMGSGGRPLPPAAAQHKPAARPAEPEKPRVDHFSSLNPFM